MPDFNPGPAVTSTSNQTAILAAPISESAVLYVTVDGSDGNNGLAWSSAFATIQAAINALPANGGTIEVGYGTFAGFSISGLGQQQIRIRGRGIGDYYAGGVNTALTSTSKDATVITNSTAATSAITLNGGAANGDTTVFVLEDLAVQGVPLTGNTITFSGTPPSNLPSNWAGTSGNYVVKLSTGQMTVVLLTNGSTTATWLRDGIVGSPTSTVTYVSTTDGINVTDCNHLILRRVVTKFHGGHGINVTGGSYWFEMDGFHAVGNANCGYISTGGTNTANVALAINSKFNSNGLDGLDTGVGYAQNYINCDFSNNGTSTAASHGNGIIIRNGGPYNVIGCFFEKNIAANIKVIGGPANIIGTIHFGDGTNPQYGISAGSPSTVMTITNNFFGGGSQFASIDNGNASKGWIRDNQSTDTNFIFSYDGTQSPGANHVVGALASDSFNNQMIKKQTLAANGAVTIDASAVVTGGFQQITLQANATSSSITNAIISKVMTIQWIEDATGGRTYVWPTNCQFTGAAAPAGTTPSTMNSVTFIYDGTNWVETARSTSVPAP